jgi:hypothetical protein
VRRTGAEWLVEVVAVDVMAMVRKASLCGVRRKK